VLTLAIVGVISRYHSLAGVLSVNLVTTVDDSHARYDERTVQFLEKPCDPVGPIRSESPTNGPRSFMGGGRPDIGGWVISAGSCES
jgi:hypothetical protein